MGVSDVFSGADDFSLASVVEILFPVRGRLRELLGGSCCGIDLLKRSLLEGGLTEDEDPNMDSVSDGAAVLLPKRFMVDVCGYKF